MDAIDVDVSAWRASTAVDNFTGRGRPAAYSIVLGPNASLGDGK
jgi:hypothetical protein